MILQSIVSAVHNFSDTLPSNPFLALITVYIAGVLVSFTPCVYPVIPLTLGVIGAKSAASRSKSFFLSWCYVSGLALTYAILGMIASLFGQVFGETSTHHWVYFIVANAYLFFGLSMLMHFNFLSLGIFHKHAHRKREGFWGVFTMGAFAGLIVGPCTAPALFAILTAVGVTVHVLYGFLLLWVFGYGVGFLLMVLGTFTGLLAAIPKSGPWLMGVQKFFGLLLIVAGEYFFMKAAGFL